MADPGGILGTIADAKRAELRRRFDGVSLDSLRAAADPARRSLAAAIARPGARFILEIKKASPSAGAIRADADVAAIARGYAGVADALSVLTERLAFRRLARRPQRRPRAVSTARSSPRISSSTRGRWPKRGSPAPTRCW